MEKKEAMKILKDFHDKSALFSIRTALDTVIPELKESEDEKIRKELLAWLKSKDGQTLPIDRFNAAIAWLEKKGEQKPVPKFKIGDTMRTLQEAKDGWTDGMPFVVSIDNEYYNCNSEKIAIKDQDEYEYPPMNRTQKPAWSEEDEENLNWFEKFFRAESVVAEGKDIPQDRYLWFKNLKYRVQPKQEWSEEDESFVSDLLDYFDYCDCLKHEASDVVDWLKSLRPQSTWKPSDEQMDNK